MKRVAVIGSPGAGKSTLSRELHEITGLPLVHLDREFWNRGWVEPDKNEFRKRILHRYQEERWIVDGHYASTMDARFARADTVFHLDYPTHICLRRLIGRMICNHGKDRPDCAGGCPERIQLEFLHYVATFRMKSHSRILETLARHPHLAIFSFGHPKKLSAHLQHMKELVSTP